MNLWCIEHELSCVWKCSINFITKVKYITKFFKYQLNGWKVFYFVRSQSHISQKCVQFGRVTQTGKKFQTCKFYKYGWNIIWQAKCDSQLLNLQWLHCLSVKMDWRMSHDHEMVLFNALVKIFMIFIQNDLFYYGNVQFVSNSVVPIKTLINLIFFFWKIYKIQQKFKYRQNY